MSKRKKMCTASLYATRLNCRPNSFKEYSLSCSKHSLIVFKGFEARRGMILIIAEGQDLGLEMSLVLL
jgi:hypothetical protein